MIFRETALAGEPEPLADALGSFARARCQREFEARGLNPPPMQGCRDLPTCNLCGFPVVRLHGGDAGPRCLRCFSTFRHRAVGAVLGRLEIPRSAHAYELSSRGALCRYLRRTFACVTVSELFDGIEPGGFRGGVQCQDVQRLTYGDAAFDVVTSTEVFEHVPDDGRAFAEVHRVLRRGGFVVFTVPLMEAPSTLERARLVGGRIVHLSEPEYRKTA